MINTVFAFDTSTIHWIPLEWTGTIYIRFCMIRILIWRQPAPKTLEGKTLANARTIFVNTFSWESTENSSIFQHTLQSLPMSSKLPNALEPQRPALQNDFFTGKKTLTHTIPISVENNSSVSGFLSFMRFKIVAFCEGQPEKIWTSLPQRRLHTFTKVEIWKSLRRRFRAESYVQP